MELIIINENKLKITLSSADMERYGLDAKDIEYSFSGARAILKSILSDAKVSTGFDTEKETERIFIQLYPSREGGCEMFVTRIDLVCPNIIEEDTSLMPAYKEQSVIPLKPPKRASPVKRTTLTYCFDMMEWVSCACRELKRRNFSGESALFRDSGGRYYLFISSTLADDQKNEPSTFLSEFATLENTEQTRLYLYENGSCICDSDAVEILSKL